MNVLTAAINAKYIHTNLAIRYLKAYAQPEFEVELAEYTIKDPDINIVTDVYTRKPDVVGFSCYIWNIEKTLNIVKMLKKINPNLVIVLGGPEVTYDPIEWMTRIAEIDVIVTGEGEAPFKRLLEELEGERDLSRVSGITYRDGDHIKVTPPADKIDLNTIPSPFRFEDDLPNLSKRITYIETSRGCPFNCQFCLSSIEVGVRYFNRERMKEELTFLMDHGAKNIKFMDRTFNISRSYAMDIFSFLIENHRPGTVFQFEITGDIMRPEVIEYLNQNAPEGLFRFEIGVQSTNDLTNSIVQRKQNFEKLARTITMIKEGGKIVQHLDLIAGLPEEDYHSFRKTFNDVFAFEPEELQLGFLKMLRGTGVRLRAADYDYRYMDHPPYEILGNSVLSFDDMIKIKQVEDVLEKYWNDHRMDHTVKYLVSHVFETPFDFFQEFGTYWDEEGWARIGHQLEDLFKRLLRFLSARGTKQLHIIEGLMKLDYLIGQNYKPRSAWWTIQMDKDARSALLKSAAKNPMMFGEAFAKLGMTEKELHKHTLSDAVSFDLGHYLATGEIVENPSILLAYYDPTNKDKRIYYTTK